MNAEMQRAGQVGKGFTFGLGFILAAALIGVVSKRGENGQSAQQGLMGKRRGKARRLRGGVTVRAAGLRARLSRATMRQDVTKQPGGTLQVAVEWTNQTTDFRGDPVRWPFAIRVLVQGQGRVFASVAQASQFKEAGAQVTSTFNVDIPGDAPAGTYTVTVNLTADQSDDQGNPTRDGNLVEIDSVTAPDKMVIPQQGGPAQPGGSIGGVTLSQRRQRRRTGLVGGLA